MSRPRRVPRPALALAAALALALLAIARPPATRASPLEARRAWEAARALRHRPWREQARPLRRVVALLPASDPLAARALRALARALRKADRLHGALACEAYARGLGIEAEPDRWRATVGLARMLREEGDRRAAHALLEEAAREARTPAPRLADRALDLMAEDARTDGDLDTLADVLARLERADGRPSLRIEVAGALGLLHLGRGEERAARQALERARAAYEDALDARDEKEAIRATERWLDCPLRPALEEGS